LSDRPFSNFLSAAHPDTLIPTQKFFIGRIGAVLPFAGLVVFLRPALEAGLLLRAIDAPSLQNFVLRGHFWPFRELIALASSS
jgi:hypothetical protein